MVRASTFAQIGRYRKVHRSSFRIYDTKMNVQGSNVNILLIIMANAFKKH